MIRFSLFILLLITTSCALTAQANEAPEVYEIDLNATRIDLADLPFVVSEVIDATGTGNAPVGIGHKGLGNRPVQLRIRTNIGMAFTGLLLRNTVNRDLPRVKLRITGLTVNEFISSTSETRKVELEAELAVPDEDGYRVYGPRTFSDVSGGLDVTTNHHYALARALRELLESFGEEMAAGPATRGMTEAELTAAPTRYAVENRPLAQIPDGFYRTYMDFRAALPSHPLTPEIRSLNAPFVNADGATYRSLRLARPAGIKLREFGEFWGAQVDGVPYMKIRDDYYELKRDDSLGLVVALPEELFKNTDAAGVIAGSAMFGLLGGLTMALIGESEKPNLAVYGFDPRTGLIRPLTYEDQRIERAMLVRSSAFSSNRVVLKVKKIGSAPLIVKPGEFIALPESRLVCFTINGGAEQCETAGIVGNERQVLYQITLRKNGKYRWEMLDEEMARMYGDKLRAGTLDEVR